MARDRHPGYGRAPDTGARLRPGAPGSLHRTARLYRRTASGTITPRILDGAAARIAAAT